MRPNQYSSEKRRKELEKKKKKEEKLLRRAELKNAQAEHPESEEGREDATDDAPGDEGAQSSD